MAVAGPAFPTVATTAAEAPWSDNDWTTPGAVTADDGTPASCTAASFDSPDQTFVLKASGFDFSAIPDGSTINGVTCRVNAWYNVGTGTGSLDLCQLLNTSGAKVGTNQCATPVALTLVNTTVITKGGASDLWGNALTAAWVKDPDFGVALGVLATQANSDVFIDYVTLEIDYTAPSVPNSGAASGAVAWVGSATGARASSGAASGALSLAGQATGATVHQGAATGSVAWAGSATGAAPAGANDGSATGTITWAGTATGARASSGSVAGALARTGSATGSRASTGTAAGTVLRAGTTTGARVSAGSAAGTLTRAGSATGAAPASGTAQGGAVGTLTRAGIATGACVSRGSAVGTRVLVGAATGTSGTELEECAPESRTDTVPAQPRIALVPAESRTSNATGL